MLERHKQPSWESGFLIILVVFSIIGFAFITENKGMASITGNVVGITGAFSVTDKELREVISSASKIEGKENEFTAKVDGKEHTFFVNENGKLSKKSWVGSEPIYLKDGLLDWSNRVNINKDTYSVKSEDVSFELNKIKTLLSGTDPQDTSPQKTFVVYVNDVPFTVSNPDVKTTGDAENFVTKEYKGISKNDIQKTEEFTKEDIEPGTSRFLVITKDGKELPMYAKDLRTAKANAKKLPFKIKTVTGTTHESEIHYMNNMIGVMGPDPDDTTKQKMFMVNENGMCMSCPDEWAWSNEEAAKIHKQEYDEEVKRIEDTMQVTKSQAVMIVTQKLKTGSEMMAKGATAPGAESEPKLLYDEKDKTYVVFNKKGEPKVFSKRQEALDYYGEQMDYKKTKYFTEKEGGNIYQDDKGYFTVKLEGATFDKTPIDKNDKFYEQKNIGTVDDPQYAYIEHKNNKNKPGKILSVTIDGVKSGTKLLEIDMATFNEIKSQKDKDENIKATNDGKIEFKDKEGRDITYEFENWKPKDNGIWEGTRSKTMSFDIYLDSQGNQISEKEYEKLTEEGKTTLPDAINVEIREEETYEEGDVIVKANLFTDDETEKGQVLKTYYHETLKVKDKDIVIEGVEMDVQTNEVTGYVYRVHKRSEDGQSYEEPVEVRFNEKGEVIKFTDGSTVYEKDELKTLSAELKKILKEAETSQSQFNSRRWFANFEFRLTQFQGLSGISQLIFSDETLASWREGVDKVFSTFYLGTDYWVSGICSKHIPKDASGTLTMRTKDGLFDVIAHVEGEKTILETPNGTKEYIYKLTFSVRNPEGSRYDELKFNVYLQGDRTVRLYETDIKVDEDDEFTRGSGKREDGQVTYDEQHGKPIVQYSNYNYNTICIRFKDDIINAEGDSEDEVCNSIVQYAGGPTGYQQQGTGTISVTGTEGQEADF